MSVISLGHMASRPVLQDCITGLRRKRGLPMAHTIWNWDSVVFHITSILRPYYNSVNPLDDHKASNRSYCFREKLLLKIKTWLFRTIYQVYNIISLRARKIFCSFWFFTEFWFIIFSLWQFYWCFNWRSLIMWNLFALKLFPWSYCMRNIGHTQHKKLELFGI